MTNERIDRVLEDLLLPKPKTRWQLFWEFVPALLAFLFYIGLFAAGGWWLWKIEQEHRENKKRCNTACVERGYHGGQLADDNCICESREILKGE